MKKGRSQKRKEKEEFAIYFNSRIWSRKKRMDRDKERERKAKEGIGKAIDG